MCGFRLGSVTSASIGRPAMMAPPAVWLLLPLGLLCLCSSAASLSGGATKAAADYVVVATSWLKTKPVCKGLRGTCVIVICPHVQIVLSCVIVMCPLVLCIASVDAPANLTASSSWVPLSHSYGPCSAAAGSLSPAPADVLLQDQHRAGYIQRKLAGSTPQDDNGSDLPESDCKSGQSEHAPTVSPNIGQNDSPTSEASYNTHR